MKDRTNCRTKGKNAAPLPFSGFPKEAERFLRALKRNNRREWFQEHREEYDELIRNPSLAFIEALRPELQKKFPHLVFSSRSMFRINRDTRFSTDKSPYKTWIGYDFWDSRGNKDQGPSLYLGWDPSGIAWGAGRYQFESAERARFRIRITEGESAQRFSHIVKKIKSTGRFKIMGMKLKKIPPGFDASHPNAEFLKCNSFYVMMEEDMPSSFYRAAFIPRAAKIFEETKPLMDWLADQGRPTVKSAESPLSDDIVKIHRDDF